MPVRVAVPTRVRVDPAALTDRRGDLEGALAAAAGRALATSQEAVLKPRGSSVQVRLNAPAFTWLGTGLENVPVSLRAEVEACLTGALWRAADRAGVHDAAPTRSWRLEQPSEPIDEDRYDELLASYELPSYDGAKRKGDKRKLNVRNPRSKPPVETVKSYSLRRLSERQARDALASEIREQDLQDPHIACLYLDNHGHFRIDIYKWPEQLNIYPLTFTHSELERDPKNKNKHAFVERELPANAHYLVGGAMPVGPDAVQILAEYLAEGLRSLAEEEKRLRSAAEINSEAKALATSVLGAKGVIGLLGFRVNGRTTYSTLIKPFPPEIGGWVRVIPLFDVAEVPKGKKTTAKGRGGAGAGGRAGERVGEGKPGGEATPVLTPEPEPAPLVEVPEELQGEKGSAFPPGVGGARITLECEPYNGEPGIDELGTEGERLLRFMTEIAHMLDMPLPPCKYTGRFLLHAAAILGARAAQTASWDEPEPAELTPNPTGAGNLGDVDFTPAPSTRISFLRHLATVVPRIHWLKQTMADVYEDNAHLIRGIRHNDAGLWDLGHSRDLIEAMNDAIATMFVRTCQVLFLQLLHASRREIEKRQNPEFVKYFAAVIVPQLEGLDELLRAQEILAKADFLVRYPGIRQASYPDLRLVNAPPSTSLVVTPGRWEDSAQDFSRSLAPPAQTTPTSDFFELIHQENGTYVVRDMHGRVWEREKLETSISFLRGAIESEEPFVKQLVKLHEVINRFRVAAAREKMNPNLPGVEAEVSALLDEFHEHNATIERDARSEPMEAFRASRISEGYTKNTIPGTHYSLQGIHLQADMQIGEFFAGAPYYALGVNELFDQVEGRKKLLGWAEFVGIVLLSIVFPPAGAAVAVAIAGGTLAYLHYREAKHKEEVYEALINPDEVLSYAEVEAALFSAKVGLVFAALPIAGTTLARIKGAIGLVARAGTEVAEEAAVVGGEVAATAARAAEELSLAARMGFAEAFAYEYTKQTVMNEAVEWALGPLLESELKQRLAEDPVGGIEGAVSAYLARMVEQREAETAAEEPQP